MNELMKKKEILLLATGTDEGILTGQSAAYFATEFFSFLFLKCEKKFSIFLERAFGCQGNVSLPSISRLPSVWRWLVEVKREIAVYQRRQARQLVLEVFVVVGVFYRFVVREVISYAVAVVVVVAVAVVVRVWLVAHQTRVFALELMSLPHLRQVLELLSQVLQLGLDVNVLGFQGLRLAHQVVDALALLEATLGRGDFVPFATSLSSIFVFGRQLISKKLIKLFIDIPREITLINFYYIVFAR
jgi:hypothetical protein